MMALATQVAERRFTRGERDGGLTGQNRELL